MGSSFLVKQQDSSSLSKGSPLPQVMPLYLLRKQQVLLGALFTFQQLEEYLEPDQQPSPNFSATT
jgi:hypothetical protein